MKKEFGAPVLAAVLLCVAISSTQGDAKEGSVGATAPKTVLKSVIGGKVESYDLQAAAAKKPVVLYFFPEAFSAG